jgi:hypothetical protein
MKDSTDAPVAQGSVASFPTSPASPSLQTRLQGLTGFKLQREVMAHPLLGRMERFVLHALLGRANPAHGWAAWPLQKTLAEEAGVCLRSCKSALASLTERGFLETRHAYHERFRTIRCVYVVHPEIILSTAAPQNLISMTGEPIAPPEFIWGPPKLTGGWRLCTPPPGACFAPPGSAGFALPESAAITLPVGADFALPESANRAPLINQINVSYGSGIDKPSAESEKPLSGRSGKSSTDNVVRRTRLGEHPPCQEGETRKRDASDQPGGHQPGPVQLVKDLVGSRLWEIACRLAEDDPNPRKAEDGQEFMSWLVGRHPVPLFSDTYLDRVGYEAPELEPASWDRLLRYGLNGYLERQIEPGRKPVERFRRYMTDLVRHYERTDDADPDPDRILELYDRVQDEAARGWR